MPDPYSEQQQAVWQRHYERWNAVNAARRQQREAAFAPYRERQAQLEQRLRSGGRLPGPQLPSSGLTPQQQQTAAGYNAQQRQALRSRRGAGLRQPSAATNIPQPEGQRAGRQLATGSDEQEQMAHLARMRGIARQEQRLARVRKAQQAMKTAQWGFRLGEAGGIMTVIGALGSLLAMNAQLIFGNFFRGRFLIPIPPLSKVEKWTTIGADFLAVFFLILALAPIALGLMLITKLGIALDFFPAEWLAQFVL